MPPGSASTLPGKRSSVAGGGGATYGPSPRCSVPLASCSATRSSSSTSSACRVPLAGQLRDDVALGVDDDQRRPGPHGVLLPGRELRVVEHRVVHGVPLDRGGQGVRVGLVRELRRVHADGDEHVGVRCLERAQLVQDVQAVDAAERPEVEQHDLAAQVGEGQVAPAGVQPAAPGQLRRAHARPAHTSGRSWAHCSWSTKARAVRRPEAPDRNSVPVEKVLDRYRRPVYCIGTENDPPTGPGGPDHVEQPARTAPSPPPTRSTAPARTPPSSTSRCGSRRPSAAARPSPACSSAPRPRSRPRSTHPPDESSTRHPVHAARPA